MSILAIVAPGLAQESGRASATGSDSLSLNGRSYQLFGIDGFELNQSCFVDGQPFACGASAVRALQTLLDPAAVECTPKGTSASGMALAVCTGHAGDIALSLVEQGWALADRSESDDYVAAEETARAGGAGAWRGTFLAPANYREGIAAIEAKYAARAGEATRTEVEEAIAAGTIDLGGLEQFTPEFAEEGARGVSFGDYEVAFGEFRPGFVNAAVEPPDVFRWSTVASVLEAMRQEGVEAVEGSIGGAVWEGLAARSSQTVDTRDAESFYAALKSSAAAWIAEGRQPVLFVVASDHPRWIRDWFSGQAPAGAEVSRNDEQNHANYLGTIDGVQVFVGPVRDRTALLAPSDILAGMTFRKDAEGRVLALQVDAATNNEWLLRYGMELDWRDDIPVVLTFPQMASPTPDAG